MKWKTKVYLIMLANDPPHDYGPLSQALRLVPLSVRRDNFDITFIQRLIEGQVDAPRLLGELSFRIPSNTRLQCNFYIPTNKSNFSRNAPLIRMMHNANNHIDY
ncbi:unnamed protein product [Macrosiphum euphorbiae]|uniref:Uncharacterized protein n=1 Tax=Macrosiphum euphorbiae TaxID=13131 RepID=A0AAV0WCJ3_9HEMI|nr:unnamed protein product [Macrosiphum euphorbiae]